MDLEKRIELEYEAKVGAQEIGGMHLLTINYSNGDVHRLLVDCGVSYINEPGSHRTEPGDLGFHPNRLETVILTHAHMDHIGGIPRLLKRGYGYDKNERIEEKKIHCAHITDRLTKGVQMGYERKWIKDRFKELTETHGYEQEFSVNERIKATFYNAGHIPGSAQVMIEITDPDTGEVKKLLFTGDVGRTDIHKSGIESALVPVPHTDFPDDIDYIIGESTYGNEKHSDIENSKRDLEQAIEQAHSINGQIICGTFSLRIPLVLIDLYRLYKDGKLPKDFPIYMDSPTGEDIINIFERYINFVHDPDYAEKAVRKRPGSENLSDDELSSIIEEEAVMFSEFFHERTLEMFSDPDDNPFNFPNLKYVRPKDDSENLTEMIRRGTEFPFMIVCSSGMYHQGRALRHLVAGVPNPSVIILKTGYAAVGTPARSLEVLMDVPVEEREPIEVWYEKNKKVLDCRAQIVKIGGYSGHMDGDENLEHMVSIKNPAEGEQFKMMLVEHGEPTATREVVEMYKEAGFERVHATEPGYVYNLTKGTRRRKSGKK